MTLTDQNSSERPPEDVIREALEVPSWGTVARGYFESREELTEKALIALDVLVASRRRPRPDYDSHMDHPERYTDGPI